MKILSRYRKIIYALGLLGAAAAAAGLHPGIMNNFSGNGYVKQFLMTVAIFDLVTFVFAFSQDIAPKLCHLITVLSGMGTACSFFKNSGAGLQIGLGMMLAFVCTILLCFIPHDEN